MFSKLALFAVASMAVFVAAAPADPSSVIENSCNSGPIQCCDQVFDSDSDESNLLGGIFNIATGPTTGQVGATCSPVTVIGASGTNCNSQPVCCNNNSFNGFVAFGCSPFNANL